MNNMIRARRHESGFSMAELLVAVVIASIVMALIATTYWSQSKTSSNQQQMVEMQQNIRSAVFFMQQDIVMAGFEESSAFFAGSTITEADSTLITFTMVDPVCKEDNINNDGDGDVDEVDEKDGVDNNGDDEIDEVNELVTIRYTLQGDQLHRLLLTDEDNGNEVLRDEIVAYNIDRLEFLYTVTNGNSATTWGNQAARDNIQTVGISILARSEFDVRGYKNTETYTALSGTVWGPFDDNFQRELVTTTVLCRNMLR